MPGVETVLMWVGLVALGGVVAVSVLFVGVLFVLWLSSTLTDAGRLHN